MPKPPADKARTPAVFSSALPTSHPLRRASDSNGFLAGTSPMATAMRTHDWSGTSIGPPETWPVHLKMAVNMMIDSAFPTFIWWNRQEMINLYNDAYVPILGAKADHALGVRAHELWREIWPELADMVSSVFDGEPVSREDMRLELTRSGYREEAFFTFSYNPIRGVGGVIDGIYCTVIETTSQVQSKQKALADQAQLEAVFQSVTDGIAVFDDQQNLILLNDAEARMHGYKSQEEMKQNLSDFYNVFELYYPDKTPVPHDEWPIARIMRGETVKEADLRVRRVDTDQEWFFSFSGSPVLNADGTSRLSILSTKDITERMAAEEELRESEARFRNLANNISQLAWTTDPSGAHTWFNQRWYDYTGTTLDQMQGWGWRDVHHPQYIDKVTAKFKRYISRGMVWEDTYPLRGRNGRYRWFLSRAVPIKDEAGQIVSWFGTNTDIDDLRRSNKRKLELEMKTAVLEENQQRLMAINQAKDEFISLASHQLRTPATGVKQYVAMLLENYAGELTPLQREYAHHAYESNERQLMIINDLLNVAQIDAGKMQLHRTAFNLSQLIRDIITEQSGRFKTRKQQISLRSSSPDVSLYADANRLRMVIENIIDNASKYTPDGKSITVSVSCDDSYALIAVTDQGVGIPPEDSAKIFDKFMRADNALSVMAGGSGLGLYLAQKIVELHGGRIEVSSRVGHGSTFTVMLPFESGVLKK